MAIFVLIHGAFHGAWCWEKLTPILEAEGHRVLAPDLAGMGVAEPGDDVIEGRIDAISALIMEQPSPVILVGHSLGGITISAVAERVHDLITRLIYLTAIIVQPGESMVDAGQRIGLLTNIMTPSADGKTATFNVTLGPECFYHRCDSSTASHAMTRLRSEPTAALIKPVALSQDRYGRVPRAYIETTDDRALPVAAQRAFRSAMPCDRVISLDTDHSPFLSMPERLAKVLLTLQ